MNHFMSHYYMPHGMCLRWEPLLVWFTTSTNAVVALDYLLIPLLLVLLIRKEENLTLRDLVTFHPLTYGFCCFIAFCGGGHAMDVLVIWDPIYWAKAWINMGTAVSSTVIVVALAQLLLRRKKV